MSQSDKINWEEVCKDCGECCGIMSFSKGFLKAHEKLMQNTTGEMMPHFSGKFIMLTTDNKCPFLDRETNRCLVYRDRPKICRLYGTIPDLPCFKIDPKNAEKELKKIDRYLSGVREKYAHLEGK